MANSIGPWMKFYPSDWRSDPRLRMCSLAARGLWIEMIALMHESDPYGHLLVSGNSPTDAQLAVLAGALPDQIPGLLGELESAGVFSRTQKGAIYSRRMTRDDKKARNARKNGKTGGNPSLGNQRGNSPSDNPQDNHEVNPTLKLRSQKPDTRDQKESPSLRSGDPPERANLPAKPDPPPRKRASSEIPNAFPGKEEIAKAIDYWSKNGRSDINAERQAELFRAHHQRSASRFVDWGAAWRTWYVRAVDFSKPDQKASGGNDSVFDLYGT